MTSATDAEGEASKILEKAGMSLREPFDPRVFVRNTGMRIVRGDRDAMGGDDALLCTTYDTPSGYEIELAHGLSYQDQVSGVAHEGVERHLIETGMRPDASDDPEEETWARNLVELEAETIGTALAAPYLITLDLWGRHRWKLSKYRVLHIPEWRLAIRLANLRQEPVAICRPGKPILRSDWWEEPVYDEQIEDQVRRGIRWVIEFSDGPGHAVVWWGEDGRQ